ncbi:hypothetical protein A2419_02035 [Candidatus Adlerbacteria bacterium RIFOXYC1_FULL_48_26]|uniref:Uncharacterized protein n=1 Tax=Candidatus Adlerbacteria bacterium RIFOXYC1_FULL_48_26 TaxID=1797247 RepID=A0A1F4Y3H0_9BACT|nr:MAG: hypothetical protein A2419_02035 [Candidatus Adlerbacteria bacterium RIFOXYC1_FULL_48_26]OGC95854.1 MAG: hypothetical protein A2590_02250 [Candidatus Adlerbacteria bacterium RIFOXYD1_FULL_48_8]
MGQRKAALLIVALLAVLVFGAWSLSTLQPTQQASVAVAIDLPLILRHSVKDGVHSYSGSISLPNACNTLSNGVATRGAGPSHLTVQLSQENVPCQTAVKTPADFLVSFTDGGEAPIVDAVTFNGMEIPFTIKEN